MLSECQSLETIIRTVLKEVKGFAIDGAEISVSSGSGLSTNVRCGEVDLAEFHRDRNLTLTLYKGGCKGVASTSDFDHHAITRTIEAAYRICQYTQSDPCAGLLEPEYLAEDIPDLDLYHASGLTIEEAIKIAQECERAALSYDSRIVNSEGASLSTHAVCFAYGNTNGFLASYPSTTHSLSCVVVAKEHDSMERDYEFSVARDIRDLEPQEVIGKKAAERTLQRLGARKIATQEVPVIFSTRVAEQLFRHLVSAISGAQLYRKSSFLMEALDKPLLPTFVTLNEVPHELKGIASVPFDREGGKTQARTLVDQGILRSYVLSGYSARKLGLKPTGHCGGVSNIQVMNSGIGFDELLATMGKGLLVTEVMGHGFDVVTGNYSKGAFGFWVENQKIQYPVHEITVAGDLKSMLQGIQAVAHDTDPCSAIQTGSVLVDTMTVAGS